MQYINLMSQLRAALSIFSPKVLGRRAKIGFFWGFENQITFLRWLIFFKVFRQLKFDVNTSTTAGIDYSKDALDIYCPLDRIYFPIFALSCIPSNEKDSLLIIGPRFENEIFIARSLGFAKKSIRTLDTFSYSPFVEIGDMHKMSFRNESFSQLLCSWTLSYSSNPKLAAKEMTRVTKIGGYLAISMQKVDLIEAGQGVAGTLSGQARIQTKQQITELFLDCKIIICIEPESEGMLICILQRIS